LKKMFKIPANLPLFNKSARVGASDLKMHGQKHTLIL